MKKYIAIIPVAALMLMASCSKDTEGVTGVTYYPVFSMKGSDKMTINSGEKFQDPGCTATLDEKDVTSQIVVESDLDFDDPTPGLYTIDYTFVNPDGIKNSVSRQVIVSAPGDVVSGFYTVQPDSYRDYGGVTYFGGYPLYIYGDEQGVYYISDLLGGWYQYRAGYGASYALSGEVEIDEDGNLSLLDSFLPGWADGANDLTDGKFDSATGTIVWDVDYSEYNFIFHVNAVKD